LQDLDPESNSLSGTIDVTRLPASMLALTLGKNDFFGSTDFGQLPKSLEVLLVNHTKLEGEIPKYDDIFVNVDWSNVKNCGNKVY